MACPTHSEPRISKRSVFYSGQESLCFASNWASRSSLAYKKQVAFVFHNLDGLGYETNPFGGNDTQYTNKARALATMISAQLINFIVYQDPNGPRGSENEPANTTWPVFDPQDGGGSGRGMVLRLDGPSVEWDDVRAAAFNWFIENDLGLFGN
ncbi:hypothetical protein E4U58_001871 [Claviceps cyperi]|nr:hypothetical protein E4U58_001871 [Claviceps cyperi]